MANLNSASSEKDNGEKRSPCDEPPAEAPGCSGYWVHCVPTTKTATMAASIVIFERTY